ncbi:restriction endonuclease [Persephonella sp.]
MKIDFHFMDFFILGIILIIVGIYAYFRYREEKHKEEKMLIPNLLSYKDRYLKEKDMYKERAKKFLSKLKEVEREFEDLKRNIKNYRWTEEDKEVLRNLKGTEFERIFTVMFELLGFKVYEPPIFKDHNIDVIIETKEGHKICVDFVDYTERKKVDEKYIKNLIAGKEKYNCDGVWFLTNRFLDDDVEDIIYKYDINLFEFNQLTQYFPSYRIVYDYDDNRTRFHNFELLYKETRDEVIRRDLWIKEVDEKISEIKRKRGEDDIKD